MASGTTGKKRTLPSWMTAVHEQSKLARSGETTKYCKNISFQKSSNPKAATESQKNIPCLEHKNFGDKSVGELISDSMPFVSVPAKVTYTYETADCACICEEIIMSLDGKNKVPIGFDMEWQASFKRGNSDKTSLIQLCLPPDQCYLFQVCGMNRFPVQLSKLITDERVFLVGLNIVSDLWKLERDFNICVKPLIDKGSVIDVGKLGNEKLKSSERWDLNGLCKNVLGLQLDKDPNIRQGNWNDIPLSREQKMYASIDAYAGLLLYQKLEKL